jgi:hypothetical protein
MRDHKNALSEARAAIRHFWNHLDQHETSAREAMRKHRLAQSEDNMNNLARICGQVPSAMFGRGKAGGND